MDTFMDKLAPRMTAQDMIKANSAADAEELNRLQNQIKEYSDCLEQMRQVNKEMHIINSQMGRLVEDRIMPQINLLVEDKLTPQIELLVQNGVARMEGAEIGTEDIKQLVEESLMKMREFQKDEDALEKLQKSLNEMFSRSDDYVHKENVKVYRNVQAVVVEEAVKQGDALSSAVKGLTGKMSLILGIAVAALVAASGGLVFQILVYLGNR